MPKPKIQSQESGVKDPRPKIRGGLMFNAIGQEGIEGAIQRRFNSKPNIPTADVARRISEPVQHSRPRCRNPRGQ